MSETPLARPAAAPYQRWEMATLGDARSTRAATTPSISKLAQEMMAARDAGHNQGYQAGLLQGRADGQAQGLANSAAVLAQQQDPVAAPPGYASVLRFMKAHGLLKRPRRGPAHSPGAQVAEQRFASREVRSYQSEYVNALWHLDFHHGSRRVLLDRGQWVYPLLLGCLDDHSRLCGHAQWYLSEGAEELCHGVGQGFQKRALPRALMTDNGAAMLAAETQEGLARLGILHETTLPYSP